jgi:phosphonate transport system substrate-binding protein
MKSAAIACAAAALAVLATTASAQDSCSHRGELDALYCDENRDLVADPPKDPKKFKNPSTLVFTYTPVEDPAVYENVFRPFTDYLGKCTSKRVVFYQVQSNAAEIEAMRSGRLHVGGFSTGPTNFAVNLAGAVPFAVKGDANEWQGYQLWLIVKKDSPIQKVTDLKGKKVAHVQPSSNSGNLAPRALFPKLGIVPDQDYKVLYSSDVFKRMAERGQIKAEDFRVIWKSQTFPTSSFAYAHDLEPKLRDTMLKCFYDYRFPAEMQTAFGGADRFFPITYQKDWAVVRQVADGSGEKFNKTAYDDLAKKEAEAAAKKAQKK